MLVLEPPNNTMPSSAKVLMSKKLKLPRASLALRKSIPKFKKPSAYKRIRQQNGQRVSTELYTPTLHGNTGMRGQEVTMAGQ